ncbi:efflux RND transporter periplasmic adaptor subunit [Sulfurospirillum arsenophilum]|uniref:efflux RND transporter periplasmic adaptor subunit n=1 Tax=Sulfurospirillum arsenophilum TaxID=56698 RepID=UPI0005AB5EF2|nr:HlyD family efflux transporter periplasmic adaptor subunit [Sulfurospirillum arsenophilum]
MKTLPFLALLALILSLQPAFAHRAIVEAKEQSVLSSELAAKIIKLPFRNGESFQKESVLIEYDCTLIKTQKEKIDVELVGLKQKADAYDRMVKLHSMSELDAVIARSEVRKKEAELKMATITVSKCQVKAPYAGKVLKTLVHEYEYVGEQKELIQIVGTQNLDLNVLVPASLIASLKEGQGVSFIADDIKFLAEGVIVGIDPAADPVSQTIHIRVKLIRFDEHIIPGIVGDAKFGVL